MIPEAFVTRWLRKEGYDPRVGAVTMIPEGGGYTGTNTKLAISMCKQTAAKDTVLRTHAVSVDR
jgi:hypothetical protein